MFSVGFFRATVLAASFFRADLWPRVEPAP